MTEREFYSVTIASRPSGDSVMIRRHSDSQWSRVEARDHAGFYEALFRNSDRRAVLEYWFLRCMERPGHLRLVRGDS